MKLSRYVFFILLVMSSIASATVLKTKCGDKLFIVEIYNGFSLSDIEYRLYYQENKQEKKIFYKVKGVVLAAACIQSKAKKSYMLYWECAGGSASREDRYGIFDPEIKRMLIQPKDWNDGTGGKG